MIDWQWKPFSSLTANELYQILGIRQAVFVVEQHCVYQDVDQLDQSSWHLMGWKNDDSGSRTIIAYCRVIFPDFKYSEPSIGRLLTHQSIRATGTGRKLLEIALARITDEYPGQPVRISAQQYLHNFYADFGFKKVLGPYDEDGIPHIEMLKP